MLHKCGLVLQSFAKISMLVYISIDIKSHFNPSKNKFKMAPSYQRESLWPLFYICLQALWLFSESFNFITLSHGVVQKQMGQIQEIKSGSH